MNKKGFTLIELLTVIAILGILVLLAAPKFLGYTEKANIAKIQTGIKSMETVVDLNSMNNPELTKNWKLLEPEQVEEINNSEKLINKKGFIKTDLNEGAKFIPLKKTKDFDSINWKSGGEFILDADGESVYYYNKNIKVSKGEDGSAVIPDDNDKNNGGDLDGNPGGNQNDDENSTGGSNPEHPIVHPNGDVEKPDGTITKPDGTVIKPDGTIIHPDGSITLEDGTDIPLATDSEFEWITTSGVEHWHYIGERTSLVLPNEIKGQKVISAYYMFKGTSVEKIVSLENEITDMSFMFFNTKASTIDLSNFDTSNVTDMTGMFRHSQATSLDLNNFDTSNVTNMAEMFYGSQATTLDLSSFDTSKVTTMSQMFYSSKATSIDLSNFDTSKVTTMSNMFYSSKSTSLDLSSFDTSNVTDMSSMFYNSQATSLDLRNFNTSKVTNTSYMFLNSKMNKLDVSSFDMSKVTNTDNMFYGVLVKGIHYALTQNDANKLNSSSNKPSELIFMIDGEVTSDPNFTWTADSNGYFTVEHPTEKGYYQYTGTGQEVVTIPHVINGTGMTSYYKMFRYSSADVKKVISTNPNVTDMRAMFAGSLSTSLDLSEFDTSKVTDMTQMFSVSRPTSLDLSSFNTSNVTNMAGMFQSSHATSLDLGSFNTSNVTDMSIMFSSSKAKSLDLSKFNTSNVTNMSNMFGGSEATSINVRSFNTSKVTSMAGMFQDSKATILDLSSFDTSKADMTWMVAYAKATTGYARTATDAARLNATTWKPSGLTFRTK